ncbi:PP2C family protein-serine/threonine phosphatase [Pseudofrankia sp. BMG5.37]|nr:PP2C family protein-serine/threonine phosphatase [Pseudofrankia sp. BMG5.37]MDT3440146.1 PP2C family protein-serine/threonine phosphatase [Pseudofrankia sp. BMG5.37]
MPAPAGRRVTGVAVASRRHPAAGLGRASGDWIEVFRLPGGRIGVSVGDASGHGSDAADHATRTRRLVRAGLVNGWEPGIAVRRAVAQLGDTGERFATGLVATLDPTNGYLRYANAGHPAALHLEWTDPLDRAVLTALPPTGPMLVDLFAGQDAWDTAAMILHPGDALMVYTDGLIEARDAAGVEFGFDRLATEVIRCSRSRTPRHLLDGIFGAVDEHTAGCHADDRAALVVARPLIRACTFQPAGSAGARSDRA